MPTVWVFIGILGKWEKPTEAPNRCIFVGMGWKANASGGELSLTPGANGKNQQKFTLLVLVLAFPARPQHQVPTGCVFTGVGALPSPLGATPLLFHPTFNLGLIILLLPALSCPANSNYSLCTNLCVNSCAGLVDSSKCPKTCVEGCHCNKGFIFDGHGCVPEDKCGCFVDGRYYKVVMS